MVFNKGTENALKGEIPLGGQILPSSILTERLEWKNAQKNEKKKQISETINKAIPHRIPI